MIEEKKKSINTDSEVSSGTLIPVYRYQRPNFGTQMQEKLTKIGKNRQ